MPLRGLVAELESIDPSVRLRAIEQLRRIGGAEAAGALVLLLDDVDPLIQARAADALAVFGPDAAGPLERYLAGWRGSPGTALPGLIGRLRLAGAADFLLAHVADPNPETRAAVAAALGHIGAAPSRVLTGLIELLRDLAAPVRIAAARALGELRDPGAVEALLDELADDSPAVRSAAAAALGSIGDRKSVEALTGVAGGDLSPEVRAVARQALGRVSVQTVTPLVNALLRDDLPERIRTANALLDHGKAAIIPLSGLLENSNASVRAAAAELLGSIGDAAAVEQLGRSAADADARVRLSVVRALGRINHPRAAELLAPVLEDMDAKIAAAAADGLERLGDSSIEPLFRMLGHESALVRVRVIDVLGRLRHKGACERLIEGLGESVAWVRIVAAQALGEIGESRAVTPLIAALSDRDALVRAMAAEALGKLRDFHATMPLLGRLNDESSLVQLNALRALGAVGNPVAIPFMIQALDNPDPPKRAAAIEGLARLRVTRMLPQLRRIARLWPFSRESGEVKSAARDAVAVLEAATAQDEASRPDA